jgi:hypothetical protein
MAKIIPITEHFQHFLAEMKKVSGAICMGRRGKRGSGFSSCSRSGSATGFPGRDAMDGRAGGGASIANDGARIVDRPCGFGQTGRHNGHQSR